MLLCHLINIFSMGWIFSPVFQEQFRFHSQRRAPCALLVFPQVTPSAFSRPGYYIWVLGRPAWLLSSLWTCCPNNSCTVAQTQKSSGCKLRFRGSHTVLLKLLVEPRFSRSHCGYEIIWPLYVDDHADWFLPLHSSVVPKLRGSTSFLFYYNHLLYRQFILVPSDFQFLLLFFSWQGGSSAFSTMTSFLVFPVVGVTRNK